MNDNQGLKKVLEKVVSEIDGKHVFLIVMEEKSESISCSTIAHINGSCIPPIIETVCGMVGNVVRQAGIGFDEGMLVVVSKAADSFTEGYNRKEESESQQCH